MNWGRSKAFWSDLRGQIGFALILACPIVLMAGALLHDFALGANNNPPPSAQWCYTALYNSSGVETSREWYPCQSNAPLWTLNQGQKLVAITPTNGTPFAPTKALQNGNSTACNIKLQLVGDAAPQVVQNIQAGQILPWQVIDVESSSTTCSNIYGIY